MPGSANVTDVRVGDEGVSARSDGEVVLDVEFDGRRVWSFWLQRDGQLRGSRHLARWPSALRRFLNGNTRLRLVEHVTRRVVFEDEVHLGHGGDRIAVVNGRGLPLGIDKSLRLVQTFETRDAEQVAPLLDSIEQALAALRAAGMEAFLAYGTLLGAVREGHLIGHDSDADLGYVSEHTYPVDVVRESFRLQRALTEMGYPITRYSGIAFRIDVPEADGSIRGLDVFGGFLLDGNLHLMGEIRTPFRRDWIFPLGTCTLEGRELPAPANTEEFLSATYGPSWRVPDPAYKFGTPGSTSRRLSGWFRGTRVGRDAWDRTYSGPRGLATPDLSPSPFARWVRRTEGGRPATVVDLGCGRGVDALWFAERGAQVIGYDYVPRAWQAVAGIAAQRQATVDFRQLNLCELRSTLTEGARVAHLPGPKVVMARHLLDTTNSVGRAHLWRACAMMSSGGGRTYLEFLSARPPGRDEFSRRNRLRPIRLHQVARQIEQHGGRVLVRKVIALPGHEKDRIARMVVEWQR